MYPPELLPGRGVGQVHLDQPPAAAGDHRAGVAHGIRVVGEGGRVQHDIGAGVDRLVQPPDQLGLVVGLPEVNREPQQLPLGHDQPGHVRERLRAVDLGFAGAEPAQVRPVEHEDPP